MPDLTAVICTHNPRPDLLAATLDGLRAQDAGQHWQLIVVDNGSAVPVQNLVDLSWHSKAHVVREDHLGLTHARLRGFHESRSEILLYIDDDNVLAPDYIREVLDAMNAEPKLGALGGKSIPRYEAPPPAWFPALGINLACRDLGDAPLRASWNGCPADERAYPACAPIGAGMAVRREACGAYFRAVTQDSLRAGLDRRGTSLASAGDNDIVMSILAAGWTVAYLPQLRLEHLIPARRLTRDYLADYAYSTNRTWVSVLDVHGIRPWSAIPAWSVPLRKAKAYVSNRAWASPANYIRWRGACGQFEARALLYAR
jgi:glycosyltransferase involved in cell wall biosynthesis